MYITLPKYHIYLCLFYYYTYGLHEHLPHFVSFVSFVICHYPLLFLFGLPLGRMEYGESNLEGFFSLFVSGFTGFITDLILKLFLYCSQYNTVVLYLLGWRVSSKAIMERKNCVCLVLVLNDHSTIWF